MPQEYRPLKVGTAAPEFRILDTDDHVHTLARCRRQERNVALFFFRGSWCGACRRQIAELSRHAAALDARGWTVIGITAQDCTAVAAYRQRVGVPFPILIDRDREVAKSYGVYTQFTAVGLGIPTVHGPHNATFLIDALAVVRFVHVGLRSEDVPDEATLLSAITHIENDVARRPGGSDPPPADRLGLRAPGTMDL